MVAPDVIAEQKRTFLCFFTVPFRGDLISQFDLVRGGQISDFRALEQWKFRKVQLHNLGTFENGEKMREKIMTAGTFIRVQLLQIQQSEFSKR